MPGPAPNPRARRRNAREPALILPASGYRGRIPRWPLAEGPTADERAAWRSLWRSPQAFAWAELHLGRTVARYVRALVVAEQPGAAAFLLAEVRHLEDRLGCSAMALLRLRWEIEPAAPNSQPPGGSVTSLDARRAQLLAEG
jgi:hypothetical protein